MLPRLRGGGRDRELRGAAAREGGWSLDDQDLHAETAFAGLNAGGEQVTPFTIRGLSGRARGDASYTANRRGSTIVSASAPMAGTARLSPSRTIMSMLTRS